MKLKTSLSKGSKSPSIIDSYIELYSLESRNLFPQSIERLRTKENFVFKELKCNEKFHTDLLCS